MKIVQGFYDYLIDIFKVSLVGAWIFGLFPLSAKIEKKLKIWERKMFIKVIYTVAFFAVWISGGILLAKLSLHEW